MFKKIDGPTPNGGEYAIIYYFNDKKESVEEKDATNAIACEYDKENKLIQETFLNLNKEIIEDKNN